EKNFGVKDFFILLVMSILIVLIVLAMRQFDRQYEHVLTIKQQNDQLAAEVARVRRQVAEMAAGGVTPGGGPRGASGDNSGVPADAGAAQRGDGKEGPSGGPAGGSSSGGASSAQPAVDCFTHLRAAERLPNFARGGWFIDNFGTKVGRLTPLISTDVYQSWVENQVMESLAVRDPYSLEFVPRVARRWEISPDGLTVTFYLRDDVTFSDGQPLTAEDVVFTVNWIRNPEVNAPRARAYMTQFKDVTAINDHTVRFTFSEPYFKNFETAATINIMPRHFYSRFTPNQFNERVGLLMGSGPYMLENPETWTPGNGVTLLRNPRYWGVEPTFDRIVFNEIQEESAEMVRYGNQQHDVIRCTPEVFERLTRDQRIMGFSNKFRYTTPYGGYSYIGWNQRRKIDGRDTPTPFADTRVRRAMTMLIDRERMAREIYLGYATVASGPFAPNGPQSNPEIKPWPYDEAAARALLEEAGFADRNRDGVIEGSDGKPLRFVLSYPGGAEI
ncbi:MAG: ABC transporter substrate-binding protein, partial [Phycisphaerae bacterium]|nr:ABC transporter substrate-binding protein [Phycisphaerae bacterium]